MEIYSASTRFALCCNYVSRIISPIASRCSKFRFKALEGDQASARISDILKLENVGYEEGVIEKSLKVSEGDLRRAINLLQSASRLAGASTSTSSSNGHPKVIPDDDSDEEMEDADSSGAKPASKKANAIKISDIDEIAGTFPPALTDRLVKVLQQGNTRNYTKIAAEVTDITASGYAANEVLASLYSKIVFDDLVESKKKYKLTGIFSEFDKRLVDGVDEHLALLDISCQVAGVLAK